MTMQIPQGPRDPVQNPVPNNPAARRVAYQQDPFDDPFGDEALVQEGTGQAYRQQGLGFGRRQQYQFDPFDQTTGTSAAPGSGVEYTQRTSDVVQQEIAQQQRDEEAAAAAPEDTPTRLEGYQETGELTPENVPDVYSLTEAELPEYGIDIHAPNVGEAPPGIVSGWNDADGDGYDDDGHAYGSHGAVNVQTAAGEQSIEDVLNYADPTQADTLGGAIRGGIARVGDAVEGYAQPGTRETSWGTDFTTSPGGAVSAALPPGFGAIAAIGGGISRANLERVHGRIEENPEYGNFYAPGEIPGIDTPIATHEGFIPGTRVVSGAIQNVPGLVAEGETTAYAGEVDAFAAARRAEAERIAEENRIVAEEQARQAQLEEDARIAAQQEAERQRQAREQAERERLAREREEQTRRERAAAERARAEAQRQEEIRRANAELERQRQQDRDNERAQIQQGRAVTDRHGRAVRDSGGRIVTDRPSQRNDSGGGGGGGDSCFSADTQFRMADGTLKAVKDIKVGDHMDYGGRVYGVLQGDGNIEDWYAYGVSYVTGSHFVLEDRWVPVEKSMAAEQLIVGFDTWYCVLNEHHMMLAEDGTFFTDFDAVDSVNDELEERLNAVQE